MSESRGLLQGTVDVLILKTLTWKPLHGYGISEFIREQSKGDLAVEDAALYQALHRLERQGYVSAEWGASENNRRARYYAITGTGRRRLSEQAAYWRSYSRALDAVLRDA